MIVQVSEADAEAAARGAAVCARRRRAAARRRHAHRRAVCVGRLRVLPRYECEHIFLPADVLPHRDVGVAGAGGALLGEHRRRPVPLHAAVVVRRVTSTLRGRTHASPASGRRTRLLRDAASVQRPAQTKSLSALELPPAASTLPITYQLCLLGEASAAHVLQYSLQRTPGGGSSISAAVFNIIQLQARRQPTK